MSIVRVVEVGIVVLIGEGFLKNLTEDLGLGTDDLGVKEEIFRFFLVLRIGDKAAYFLDFSPIICRVFLGHIKAFTKFEPSCLLECFHFGLDCLGEEVDVGFQGGLLKVAAGLLDGGDCAVLGLDKLKDISRNSLLIEFPGSSFGGGSGKGLSYSWS